MQTYFITANDTDVGKTYVTGLLARHFALQGQSVQVVKVIECGGSGDAQWAADFSGCEAVSAHTLLDYPEPLAPLAAENVELGAPNLSVIFKALEALPLADVRLVEGAGGVAVPIDASSSDWRDFAEQLSPDLTIAVIDHRLGAINQSRLVHSYLGDLPHAFVLNEVEGVDAAVKASNLSAYRTLNYKLLAFVEPSGKGFAELNTVLLETDPGEGFKPNSYLQARLDVRKSKDIFRALQVPDYLPDTLNLAENDYLGLRNEPRLIESGVDALKRYGTSSSSSPLITGYTKAHFDLEAAVSEWYGGAPALVWNSGYAANQSVLQVFVQPGDVVIADRLIHHSLISGVLASGARLVRFQHNDLDHLERLLRKFEGCTTHVVSESLYSMDGDYPDLRQIAYLKSQYGFQWYLDEAHAVGWYGVSGSGLAEVAGVVSQVDVLTGTLGKALASSGAYTVFRESWMRDLCINQAGEFIYSTYLPPAVAAIATAAIAMVQERGADRPQWQVRACRLRESLRQQGWEVLGEDSPVVPVLCGESAQALAMSARFLAAGIKVAAIRPPTVPTGGARLRLSLKSTLTEAQYGLIKTCFQESASCYV